MTPHDPTPGALFVTGATGYVGGRLVPALLAAGHEVRCLAREPRKLDERPWRADPNVQIVTGDMSDVEQLVGQLDGCTAAYYLVHSMEAKGGEYAAQDRLLASNFARAAARAGVQRIIYLGGLGEMGAGLSAHLQSRREVETGLASSGIPVTTFRAAMIIGAGSASFEILRYLVERLPVMVTPSWVKTESQPVAVDDVLHWLVRCLGVPETAGRTHLAYKAEHAVDLGSGLVLAAAVHPADQGDAATLVDSLFRVQINLVRAGLEIDVEEAVADKGYHKAETLAECAGWGWRAYIPEPKRKRRNWKDKPDSWRVATAANRRRVKGARSKRLQKKRSELVERSFAHVCESGGGRRTWLRGRTNVTKRYLVQVAAFNLGVVMRSLFGVGKPRVLQGAAGTALALVLWLWTVPVGWIDRWYGRWAKKPAPGSRNFADR